MPYINLQITQGATREQKATIVKEFTETLVRTLGKKPEHTHIVIQEIAEENWGFEGMLTDEWKKKENGGLAQNIDAVIQNFGALSRLAGKLPFQKLILRRDTFLTNLSNHFASL